MTLSLVSKFEFNKRRALFISAHKATVYHWEKGQLGSSYLFDANDDGRKYFERYLRETTNIPMYVLVDVFEEEFKRDTVPHVFGPDRAAMVERKKARLFRDSAYYYFEVQGRETTGRKDDQLLLSAITNSKLLGAWIELLEAQKVPLVGIYSVPLLTASLVKTLPDLSDNSLVVSIQSISGLRQTFIQNNQLRVSRLVQLPRYGTEPYAPHIKEEVDKIRRYLNSLRLIPAEQMQTNPLNVYFLLTGDLLEELKQEYRGSSVSGLHFLDVNELLEKAGSIRRVSSPFSDQLFVHQLLKQKPANYYARPHERRFNTMRNLRLSMLAASALMFVGSVAWSGYAFMGGLEHRQNTLAARGKTEFYQTRYTIAREGLPQIPVEPADLRVAVELYENLKGYKSTPIEMMRLIGSGMNRFPAIKLGNFDWVASIDPNLRLGGGSAPANQGVIGYSGVGTTGNDYKYYQIAVISAEVSPFDGNYRGAISLINEFAETLRSRENVHDVSILSLPLDISSSANMQGSTGSVQREARFSIRVTLGVGA
ncbi:MAG: hypothetical protein WD709_00800 [Gammaproteobacteria bacterium]